MPTHADTAGTTASWEWHHSGLVVDDLDAAIRFYSETLGYTVDFEARGMTGLFSRTVGIDGVGCDLAQLVGPLSPVRLELIQVRGVPAGLDPRLPVHVGVGHGAYLVDDLEAAVAAVVHAGGRALGEIVAFDEGPAVYCWTAAGTILELEARTA